MLRLEQGLVYNTYMYALQAHTILAADVMVHTSCGGDGTVVKLIAMHNVPVPVQLIRDPLELSSSRCLTLMLYMHQDKQHLLETHTSPLAIHLFEVPCLAL